MGILGAIVDTLGTVGSAIGDAAEAVGDVISGAAKAVGDALDTVVNAVGEMASDLVETIGNFLHDGLDWLGEASGSKFLKAGFHRLGGLIAAVTDFVAGVIKGVTSVIGGIVSGLIKIVVGGVGGLLAWDGRVFVEGVGDVLAGVFGGLLGILGKTTGLIQAVLGMQWGRRSLTRAEKAILEQVFRNSVALYNVRVVDGFAGIFSINRRPFTLGNTIYMKSARDELSPDDYHKTLVHECTHVWQYQNLGYRYTMDALWAQWTLPGEGYRWQDEFGRGRSRWWDFNREAQAQFVEDVWQFGRYRTRVGNGVFYTDDPIGPGVVFIDGGTNYTTFARDSINDMRGHTAIRLSNVFS